MPAPSAAGGWCGARTTSRRRSGTGWRVFEQQTAPVFEWYRANGTHVATVDATGTVEAVTERALHALGRGR